LANILVDWVWYSGRYGIAIPQSVLGLTGNGKVDNRTIHALNDYPDPEGLFEKIKQVRRAYLNMICIDRPANRRFLKGWLNRLNDFRWIPMALLFLLCSACKTVKYVPIETVKTEYRDKILRDSIFISDTIRLPYPVEVVKEVKKPLSGWQNFQVWCGRFAFAGVLLAGIYLALKLKWRL